MLQVREREAACEGDGGLQVRGQGAVGEGVRSQLYVACRRPQATIRPWSVICCQLRLPPHSGPPPPSPRFSATTLTSTTWSTRHR